LNPKAWSEVRRERPCIIAMGNFDGVHLGHARVLDALVREASAGGLDPVLITYEPHPRYFFKPNDKPSLLTTPREKLELLSAWPVEVLPLAFDKSLASLEAANYIKEFLQGRLRGERFLLGHDHRFGKGARGDDALLKTLVPDPERNVIVSEPLALDGEVVSSSAIRAHLEAARVEAAARLLGRPFSYSGAVVRGEGRGRTLGIPTANLDTGYANKAVVALGVYGGTAVIAGKELPAVANIGINPTFLAGAGAAAPAIKIEVHVLDFSGDLYGQRIEFRLRFHVRPERKFDSVEALRARIGEDIAHARRILKP
jgi:riboflavin kinase / FMN adenylyltransferase